MTSNPLKWHGGKSYLADWIISHMPPHTLYREPFFGGGAVLFKKPCEGIGEAVNDLNKELWYFWRTMQTPEWFKSFQRWISCTPLCEGMMELVEQWDVSNLDMAARAAKLFIRYRMSRQGLGKDYTTPTTRTRRGMSEQVSAWLSSVEGLPEAHERLIRVEVCNMDAVAFIKKYDAESALFYCDPPYLHETREKNSTDSYECEMTTVNHERLLECLGNIKGRFMLSGYPSALYEQYAAGYGWRLVTKEIDNKSSGAKVKAKKLECLWMNY